MLEINPQVVVVPVRGVDFSEAFAAVVRAVKPAVLLLGFNESADPIGIGSGDGKADLANRIGWEFIRELIPRLSPVGPDRSEYDAPRESTDAYSIAPPLPDRRGSPPPTTVPDSRIFTAAPNPMRSSPRREMGWKRCPLEERVSITWGAKASSY